VDTHVHHFFYQIKTLRACCLSILRQVEKKPFLRGVVLIFEIVLVNMGVLGGHPCSPFFLKNGEEFSNFGIIHRVKTRKTLFWFIILFKSDLVFYKMLSSCYNMLFL
jgi:energy-converting hydrogenase Eha subunit H